MAYVKVGKGFAKGYGASTEVDICQKVGLCTAILL